MTSRLRADLHAHTCYSADARTTPAQLIERAGEAGIDRIAVTDHGEVEGAFLARSMDPRRVIVGEEIRCRCGTELIGLFLRERIPVGLSLDATVERIRDQGGLVYAPHPWAYLHRPAWRARRAVQAADIVEVFNSRAFWGRWNRRAVESASAATRAAAASSDAHFPHEIGRAWTELPSFAGPKELLASLGTAEPVGRVVGSPALHVASVAWRIGRQLAPRPGFRAACDEAIPSPGR